MSGDVLCAALQSCTGNRKESDPRSVRERGEQDGFAGGQTGKSVQQVKKNFTDGLRAVNVDDRFRRHGYLPPIFSFTPSIQNCLFCRLACSNHCGTACGLEYFSGLSVATSFAPLRKRRTYSPGPVGILRGPLPVTESTMTLPPYW
ncbi:hypothetical protein 2203_scaffold802_00059 [Bacteriophage sp.]|nr:hypothetical protein 2203_scaffold802_00059 [Bacteriophage sp.]